MAPDPMKPGTGASIKEESGIVFWRIPENDNLLWSLGSGIGPNDCPDPADNGPPEQSVQDGDGCFLRMLPSIGNNGRDEIDQSKKKDSDVEEKGTGHETSLKFLIG